MSGPRNKEEGEAYQAKIGLIVTQQIDEWLMQYDARVVFWAVIANASRAARACFMAGVLKAENIAQTFCGALSCAFDVKDATQPKVYYPDSGDTREGKPQ